jgi:hypothetical protein
MRCVRGGGFVCWRVCGPFIKRLKWLQDDYIHVCGFEEMMRDISSYRLYHVETISSPHRPLAKMSLLIILIALGAVYQVLGRSGLGLPDISDDALNVMQSTSPLLVVITSLLQRDICTTNQHLLLPHTGVDIDILDLDV